MEVNLPWMHDSIAAQIGDRLALVCGERRLTWAEVAERTNRFAHVLSDRGIEIRADRASLQPWESGQDHVALLLYNCPEYLEAMIGSFKARAVPINVNYRYVAEELRYVLRDSGSRVVVYHASLAPALASVRDGLPDLKVFIQVQDDPTAPLLPGAVDYEQALASASPGRPDLAWSPDDLYILYTGGTTGMPKGVLWRQADIFSGAVGANPPPGYVGPWGIDEVLAQARIGGLRSLPTSPLMHGAAHWFSLFTWHSGGTVFLSPNATTLDPPAIWRLVEEERVNALSIVGDAFAVPLLDALESGSYDTSSLVLIASGGAPLNVNLKRRFLDRIPQAMLLDSMGSSEAGMQGQNVSRAGENVSTGPFQIAAESVVLDEHLTRVLQVGDDGVGWVARSGAIPLGYLGDREKTERTFPEVDGTRYAVAGDRARVLGDGSFELLGRDAVTINSGGEKIFAEEVEQALRHHRDVYDVVVVGRPSERWGSECVAIVQRRPGTTPTVDDLLAIAAERIARYKLPKQIQFVSEVRRSPAGKADYRWAAAVAVEDAPTTSLT